MCRPKPQSGDVAISSSRRLFIVRVPFVSGSPRLAQQAVTKGAAGRCVVGWLVGWLAGVAQSCIHPSLKGQCDGRSCDSGAVLPFAVTEPE